MSEHRKSFEDEPTLTYRHGAQLPELTVLDWGAATSVGAVRPQNEDRWDSDDRCRFVVADGMGGTAGGQLAAKLATTEFLAVDQTQGWVPELARLNQRVAAGCRAAGYPSAGSTLVGLHLEPHRCVTVHVGDSRIYRLRDRELRLLTMDHSLRNLRLEEGLDPAGDDQRGLPQALTSWIGAPHEPDRIDIGTLSVQDHDRILLVTDGVSGQLSTSDIHRLLSSDRDAGSVAAQLVQAADDAGGRDNATALLVELGVDR